VRVFAVRLCQIAGHAMQRVLEHYLRSEEFWTGFVLALILLLTFSHLSAWGVKEWNRVRQTWAPVKRPGKLPEVMDPSPLAQVWGCLVRLMIVGGVVTFLVLWWWSIYARR
jgi:hypothetical protein